MDSHVILKPDSVSGFDTGFQLDKMLSNHTINYSAVWKHEQSPQVQYIYVARRIRCHICNEWKLPSPFIEQLRYRYSFNTKQTTAMAVDRKRKIKHANYIFIDRKLTRE